MWGGFARMVGKGPNVLLSERFSHGDVRCRKQFNEAGFAEHTFSMPARAMNPLWVVILLSGLICPPAYWGAGMLSGSFTKIPAGTLINLSAAGALDWVHWGLYTETSLDRKTGVPALISDFTLVSNPLETNGTVHVFQFSDNFNG